MKGSDLIFDCVHLFYNKCPKINFKCVGSYIGSHDWIKNKKASINHINEKDNKYFQYTIPLLLNDQEIGKHPEKLSKVKPVISKYNWEGINYLSEKADLKKIEKKIWQFLLTFYMLENKYIFCLRFKK